MRYLPLMFIALFLLVGCSSGAPEPTVVIPTIMELPTQTATPSTPTDVPPPTDTATVTPSPLPPTDTPSPVPPTSTPSPSPTATVECDVMGWVAQVNPVLEEFFDTAELAVSTPRSSLAPIVLELQRVQRAFDRLELPHQCEEIRQLTFHLSLGLNFAVEGYRAFLASEDFSTEYYFGLANQAFFDSELVSMSITALLDYRVHISDTIWGGEMGSAARATDRAINLNELYAQLTATYTSTVTVTATATQQRFGNAIMGVFVYDIPSTDGNRVGDVHVDGRVQILEFSDDGYWTHIRLDNGIEGWVMTTILRVDAAPPTLVGSSIMAEVSTALALSESVMFATQTALAGQ